MVEIIAIIMLLTGFLIFFRFSLQVEKLITKFHNWWIALCKRDKLDQVIGIMLILTGSFIIVSKWLNIRLIITFLRNNVELFCVVLGSLLLIYLYTIIIGRIFTAKKISGSSEVREYEDNLEGKIQNLRNEKRQISLNFHLAYHWLLGFLFITMSALAFFGGDLAEKTDNYDSIVLLLITITAVLISLKNLFLNEADTTHWLQILYNRDPDLANDELDRDIEHSKRLKRNAYISMGLGVVIGILVLFLIIMRYKG